MSEAKDDSTQNPRRVTLTMSEVHSLADRLFSRGVSKLSDDTVEQQRDLRVASRVLRALLKHFSATDTVSVEINGA